MLLTEVDLDGRVMMTLRGAGSGSSMMELARRFCRVTEVARRFHQGVEVTSKRGAAGDAVRYLMLSVRSAHDEPCLPATYKKK